MTNRLTLTAVFGDLRNEVKSRKTKLANAMQYLPGIAADLATAKRVFGKIEKNDYTYAYISGETCPTLNFTCDVDVENFKTDARLGAMLGRAVDADLQSKDTTDYVTDWTAQRCFQFKLPNGGTMKIEARLKADGTNCRKVIESTKLVEQHTYKIVCD